MRFANLEMLQMLEDAKDEGQKAWEYSQQQIDARETPAIKLDPSSLDLTVPEMQGAPYYPGQDLMRDKYITNFPQSGIS